MKIAIPTRENVVDDHFGHCAFYSIFTIENDKIINKSILPSPQGCGCKSNIAYDLKDMGISVMLAGNMGEGAKNKLNSCDIKVIRGCKGDVDLLVKSFINGEVFDSGNGCAGHGADHVCNH